MKVTTPSGITVDRVSTVDRGEYFIVKSPGGYKLTLDPWNPQSHEEIRTLEQLAMVLARADEKVPAEFGKAPEPEPLTTMVTKGRQFEVTVIQLNGREQFRLRKLNAYHEYEWLGNFTGDNVGLLFTTIKAAGGDPATLREVTKGKLSAV